MAALFVPTGEGARAGPYETKKGAAAGRRACKGRSECAGGTFCLDPGRKRGGAVRRVVITGLGAIAPNGIGKEAFWEATVSGVSGAEKITKFDVSQMTSQMACEVKNFDPRAFDLSEFESTRLDRHVQFALAAAQEAVEDADLDVESIDRERAGVFVGSTNSSIETFESTWESLTRKGEESFIDKTLPPDFYLGLVANAAPASIAIHYGFKGPSILVSDACSSAVNAV